MTKIKNATRQLIYAAIFSCLILTAHGQDAKKTIESPQRPKFSSNIRAADLGTIDNIVTLSFSLLRSVDEISSKVDIIKNQLQGSVPDASFLLTQINECTSALNAVGTSTPALADDIANMIGNIKGMHIPLLKIPLVIKNLNEARKAIQYCISYARYFFESSIPKFKEHADLANQVVLVKN